MFLNDCYCHLGLTFGENDLLKKLGVGGRRGMRLDSIVFVSPGQWKTSWDVKSKLTLPCTSSADQSEAAVSKQRWQKAATQWL